MNKSEKSENRPAWKAEFYGSKAWKECRDGFLRSKRYLCEDCREHGRLTAAVVAHHMIPLTAENYTDPRVAYNWSRLRAVCVDCHAARHRKAGRYTVDETGELLPVPPVASE